ncbi:retrovirus-related pol polyprotein from transposon TNT 1-94 [Tanacetum coccineum]
MVVRDFKKFSRRRGRFVRQPRDEKKSFQRNQDDKKGKCERNSFRSTVAENVIAAGAENRPPMLEKCMYDSWKSCILLYIEGKENGEMLIDLINHGPFQFKVITVPTTEATNIILLGLPIDIYTFVNHHKTTKDIWDQVKELMEGTELTIQERDSKLYDDFDIFMSEKGESIHSYYLRYAKLINDMNIINMKMTPIQINTKFVNHLQPEWSRFVTVAKQAKDLHKVNFDQLYAYLKQNKNDANEVRAMRHRYPNPLALLANTYNLHPSYSIVQQQSPAPSTQLDLGLVVPSFLPTDDPIASLNKAMITQATIQDGTITVQNVQGRKSQGYGVNTGKGKATGIRFINTVRDVKANQPRVIRCYNCKGKGHIAKQCTTKKRLHTTSIFKADHVDAFDSDCDEALTASAIFMARLSHSRSINGDVVGPTYDSYILSQVPHYDTHHDTDMLNPIIQDTEYYEHFVSINDSNNELTSNSNVISYAEYMVTIKNNAAQSVPHPEQDNAMILSIIKQMQSQVKKCNTINQENKSVNESLTSELERYKEKVKVLEER